MDPELSVTNPYFMSSVIGMVAVGGKIEKPWLATIRAARKGNAARTVGLELLSRPTQFVMPDGSFQDRFWWRRIRRGVGG